MNQAIVQTPEQFLTDFIAQAEKATKRIYLQSMLFERGRFLETLEPILIKKAKDGIDVQVTIDWVFNRYVEDKTILFPEIKNADRKYNEEVHQETKAIIKRWEEAGITFTITNKPSLLTSVLPILGRNHIKIYLIDDAYAWIGGINLFDTALSMIDFIVRMTDPAMIAAIAEQYFSVNEKRPNKNYRVAFPPHYEFLIDAGKKKDSLIYDEAISLIQHAKTSIIFMSQFLPDGKLLYALSLAGKRGVKIAIITSDENNKSLISFPYKVPYQLLKKRVNTIPNCDLLHREKRVHAKLLVIDDEKAIFGSHNFTSIGVLLGTEEIAICTTDKPLVETLVKFSSTP